MRGIRGGRDAFDGAPFTRPPSSATMDPLVWMAVGLGVGLLAPLVAGEGDGLFGDLLFGLLGAFLGGWITALAATPPAGLAGSALAALGGAAAFVLALRLVHHATATPA
jgi:uncharacterized membrane protein YeaQ/YmgE (transglycosylase-associated protein family)